MKSKRIDLKGKEYGRLTVIDIAKLDKHGRAHWNCVCSCGSFTVVCGDDLRSGHTKSCGCLQKERASLASITHGLRRSPLYEVWASMKQRIFNKNRADFMEYGGRGIDICDDWLDFEKFYSDMSPTYKEGLTINRINVNGDYCPENCNWDTRGGQSHFKRKLSGCSSKYYGVSFSKTAGKYIARISINGSREHLGCFTNEVLAATAYDNRSEELYGDRPNGTTRQNKEEDNGNQ